MGISLKLTAKGQLTLKKEYLQHLGIAAGDNVEVVKLPDGSLNIRAQPKKLAVDQIAGLLADKVKNRFSIEEINQAIADSYAAAGNSGLEKS